MSTVVCGTDAKHRDDCLGCAYSQAKLVWHHGLEYEFRCHHPDTWHQAGEDRVVGYSDERPAWCPVTQEKMS